MTANQIRYHQLQEEKRSNQAMEKETNRSNLAKELETNRANLAKEQENYDARMQQFHENRREWGTDLIWDVIGMFLPDANTALSSAAHFFG